MSAISPDLLQILRCPQNSSALTEAEPALVERLNRAIAAGKLRNQAGTAVEKPLDGALVRADRQLAYPVVDGLPVMLADESIQLAQVETP